MNDQMDYSIIVSLRF